MTEPLSLEDKQCQFRHITERTGWPQLAVAIGLSKVEEGHNRHGNSHTLKIIPEALLEAVDIPGYGAIARVRHEWSWEWWIIVFLAGVQARLLLRMSVARERRKMRRLKRSAAKKAVAE